MVASIFGSLGISSPLIVSITTIGKFEDSKSISVGTEGSTNQDGGVL